MKQDFSTLATTEYGNILGNQYFMDFNIVPLWQDMPRIFGEAFTVQLAAGDNLMLHAAIYEAPEGSIIVVDGVDSKYAVAGGNVCAVAKSRGIKGFIIDGVIRDLSEISDMEFPVFAKGVHPVPGEKKVYSELGASIACGGVRVSTGDVIVADVEGIVVIPKSRQDEVFTMASKKAREEASLTLAEWEMNHRAKIDQAITSAKQKA
ncbi:RraA family protein [Vibrio lentus]|uniref:Putative 4-hydroxy-4-methyl-2-oxoglutarate aldolase n=1 Tax=Vibrio lentus TaxID=136468 RepID=A0A2N7BIF3_9VIBR|nr:RraA family protein [Vibrio lentus]PME47806.1 diguanylate cyclase [Vibrio lentus]PME55999.1 diguanylate cyclase [Vibrio lentus]PME79605.1 diguanylate cyclase [Vibrio lentus]PMH94276.1 diguanylate cyclase [Vibrio lentus]PMI04340.1 diguanylate cyclase [Vibrio lentus]